MAKVQHHYLNVKYNLKTKPPVILKHRRFYSIYLLLQTADCSAAADCRLITADLLFLQFFNLIECRMYHHGYSCHWSTD